MVTMYDKMILGEITTTEYNDYMAKKRGFSGVNEYNNYLRHEKGVCTPHNKNKDCAQYLGIYIAERILSNIFEDVIRMAINNKGYDFICKKGYKIDVKSVCFSNKEIKDNWHFTIAGNKFTDYFLLLAFDNRKDLNPLHIWLIKGDEIINRGKLSDKQTFKVQNNIHLLSKLKKYEQTNKLDKLKECCNTLRIL